ncbi:MAG: insulinase family protein [Gemmatimonadetes bacterium]|nr:insulinase family protein [Gemmatimonadota bacterium]
MSDASFLSGLTSHRLVLGNGLTVLVREEHSAPVVAVVTHVKAGYFDEPDAIVGISHVLEHMYFKGTERRGVGEIARETKASGGYLNAGTIYDHTSYYTVLPAAALEQALDIQADALQHSAIAEGELRRELQVIIQEAKRKLDNPEAVAQEKLFEAMFDTHRIRRWRIGTESVLGGLTRADVLRYYRALYHPSNTILVIAGAVTAARAFDLAERYYGAMPAGEVLRDPGPPEAPVRGFRFRELAGDIMHSYLEWGWRTPGTLHPDTPVLDVLALVLGQGRASRLYRQVRDAGLATAISAYNYTPTQLGVFGVSAELRPERTEAAIAAIAGVLSAAAAGCRAEELQRAHNILEARLIRRLETAEGQARLLAEWEALGGWELAREYLERLLATTPAARRRAARQYLDHERGTLLLHRPEPVPPADLVRLGRALHTPGTPPPPLPVAPAVARPAAAPLTPERVADDVRFHTTAAGTRIAILPRAAATQVSISVNYPGGTLHEPAAAAGVTSLMARASVKATLRRSGAALAEATEALGSSIAPAVAPDGFSWSMTLPSRHLDEGLVLIAEAVLEPAFAADDVARERDIALSDLEQVRDDMYNYPLRLVLEQGFGAHPYGWGIELLETSLRAADAERVRDWHAAQVTGRAPWVFVVGAVPDPDALAGLIGAHFAPAAAAPPDPVLPVADWQGSGGEIVRSRRKAQTAIVLGFPGPPRNHPDLFPLRVLSNAIGGLGGRLFEELRSRRSLAYAVAANPLARWQGGAFVAYIGTSPEREEEARTELLRELLHWTVELLPADEIERAQRYTIGARQIRRQSNAGQLAVLADALMYGAGLEEIRAFEARIEAVTAEQMRAAAARWLDPGRLVTGVVRGSPERVD